MEWSHQGKEMRILRGSLWLHVEEADTASDSFPISCYFLHVSSCFHDMGSLSWHSFLLEAWQHCHKSEQPLRHCHKSLTKASASERSLWFQQPIFLRAFVSPPETFFHCCSLFWETSCFFFLHFHGLCLPQVMFGYNFYINFEAQMGFLSSLGCPWE